jgi:hypothetical protein
VEGSFFFSLAGSGAYPYLYFATSASGQKPFDVEVALDDVFVSASPPQPLPGNGPFKLEQGKAPFPYKAFVSGQSLFHPTEPLRTSLCQAFDTFLDELDAAGLKPGRLRLIRGLLAQTLPLTFAETLYFRYGLNPVARQIDLSPEMRLRIDFQAHQAVEPHDSLLNGFVGAGTSYVQLGELAGGPQGTPPQPSDASLTFDRFLALQQGMSVASSPGGSGGAVDLQGAAAQMPHWRLVYPQTFPGSAGAGEAVLQGNPALLGAPTRAALAKATQAYAGGGAIESPAVAVFFRGRAAVLPEIPVYVRGQRSYVAVGTTIRDLVSGLSAMPRMQAANVDMTTQTYSRVDNRVSSEGQLQWGINFRPVTLSNVEGGYQWYGEALDSFDLPVLSGDVFSFHLPEA